MAKRRIYTLTEDSMRELSQTLYQLRNEVEELRYRLNGRAEPARPRQLCVGKTTAAGTAISGSTPGSVAVSIYARNSSGVLTVQEAVTAYVLLPYVIATDKWLFVERDRLGDYYVVDSMPEITQKTLLEDWRVNGTALEGKYCTCYVIKPSTGAWTNLHTGTSCT